MHTVTFFPIGNADSCLIELNNGRRVMFDYANMLNADDETDKRCDLESEIRDRIGSEQRVDVVAFTHFDTDHCKGARDLFYLEHAEKYQDDDRIVIDTMWVPANAILEEGVKGQARVLRAEARHRFLKGEGIRVFSSPHALDKFLEDRDISPEDRRHLITNAGEIAPEFSIADDGVEFFIHSPFAQRDEGELVVRNDSAIFVHATFSVDGTETKLILSADVGHTVIEQIVEATVFHENQSRLEWDINNIPHHCSYLSLADEKGASKTKPSDNLDWLYSTQSKAHCILVSTSCPIPTGDTDQPPHRQAANYYRSVADSRDGEFLVTMEHPSTSKPKPLVIEIGGSGHTVKKSSGGSAAIIASATPRAGYGH